MYCVVAGCILILIIGFALIIKARIDYNHPSKNEGNNVYEFFQKSFVNDIKWIIIFVVALEIVWCMVSIEFVDVKTIKSDYGRDINVYQVESIGTIDNISNQVVIKLAGRSEIIISLDQIEMTNEEHAILTEKVQQKADFWHFGTKPKYEKLELPIDIYKDLISQT